MQTAEFLSTLTISQLKDLCKSKNLTVGGNKGDLIQKLLNGSQSVLPSSKTSNTSSSSAYDNLSVKDLQSLCWAQGLTVSSTKKDLLLTLATSSKSKSSKPSTNNATLSNAALPKKNSSSTSSASSGGNNHNQTQKLHYLTISDLKELCRAKGLAVSGVKDDLISRLITLNVL